MADWSSPNTSRVHRITAGSIIVISVLYSMAIIGQTIVAIVPITVLVLIYIVWGFL